MNHSSSQDEPAELRAEIGRLDEDIRSNVEGVDRLFALVGLISAGVVTLGLATDDRNPIVPIVAPYGLTITITYIIQLYTDIAKRVTLRQHLEGLLRQRHQVPAFQPIVLNYAHRNRPSVRLIGGIYAIATIALFWLGWQTAEETLNAPLLILNRLALLASAAVIVVAFVELNVAEGRAKRELA